MNVGKTPIKFQEDSDASCNVINVIPGSKSETFKAQTIQNTDF